MLEDMYKALTRINELQRRFKATKKPAQFISNAQNNKFDNSVNEHIAGSNKADSQNEIKTNITVPKIKEIAKDYAIKKGLPPALVDAVIKAESDYNPNAVSRKGAAGLMQLMPGALAEMGVANPFNAEDNIQAGVGILKKLMDKYEWDFKKALAAYNAGEKAVDRNSGIPPIKETHDYIKKVMDAYIQNIK
ncbi:MAG: lytic transglycosylase domain-containing protein [Spirochaetota bacterium]